MLYLALAAVVVAGLLFWRLGLAKKVADTINPPKPATPKDPSNYDAWEVGPVVKGENRSPRSVKVPHPGAIFAVEIPFLEPVGDRLGELSGVTFPHGPLTGKTAIRFRLRVEADEGVRLVTSQHTPTTSIVAFIQRFGDNWSAKGEYEDDRWYGTFAPISPVEVNRTYEIEVPLDGPWTSTQNLGLNPAGFADTKANAERVGLVLGGGDGWAHGLYATGPARLIVEHFEVV